jgi:sugar diacid utilization regulator
VSFLDNRGNFGEAGEKNMSISVKEAMNIGGLKKSSLIAGHNGIGNLIEHVSVIEVPDAHEWFRGKELFLSAFYNIENDVEKQLNLLKTIKEKNGSALGVCYPGLYYDTLSPKVLAKANELSIPIIEIPRDVAYIDIISPITESIQRRQSVDLQQSLLIDELLAGSIVSPQHFIDRAVKLGLNFHSKIGLAVIQPSKESLSLEQLSKFVNTFLNMERNKSILFLYGGTLLVFLEDSLKSEIDFEIYYHGLFEKLSFYVNKKNLGNLNIVFSKQEVNLVKEARGLCKELMDILTIKMKMIVLPAIMYAPKFPIFLFLHSNSYHPAIIKIRKLLDPLEKYDEQYQTDLMETLEHLLFSKDIQQLPSHLNIHRNTLNYRRQRIKEILQVNPFCSPYRTQCELAILLRKLD